jgi:hypothetical protein
MDGFTVIEEPSQFAIGQYARASYGRYLNSCFFIIIRGLSKPIIPLQKHCHDLIRASTLLLRAVHITDVSGYNHGRQLQVN